MKESNPTRFVLLISSFFKSTKPAAKRSPPGRVRKRYLIFAVIFAVIAAMIPHFVDGHILFLPRAYAESVGIITNTFVALVFYALYKRDISLIMREKEASEERLLSSYKYIGKANRLIQMLQNYSTITSADLTSKGMKTKLSSMVDELATEVMKADKALVRFIKADSGRTIAEFSYTADRRPKPIKLANKEILKLRSGLSEQKSRLLHISREYRSFGVVCAAAFENSRPVADTQTIKNLINQVFLSFVVYKAVSLSMGSLRTHSETSVS